MRWLRRSINIYQHRAEIVEARGRTVDFEGEIVEAVALKSEKFAFIRHQILQSFGDAISGNFAQEARSFTADLGKSALPATYKGAARCQCLEGSTGKGIVPFGRNDGDARLAQCCYDFFMRPETAEPDPLATRRGARDFLFVFVGRIASLEPAGADDLCRPLRMSRQYSCERLYQLEHALVGDEAADKGDAFLLVCRKRSRRMNAGMDHRHTVGERVVDAIEKTATDEITYADDGIASGEQLFTLGNRARAIHAARVVSKMEDQRGAWQFAPQIIHHHGPVEDFDEIWRRVPHRFHIAPYHLKVATAQRPSR